MDTEALEWAKSFENKSESELAAMTMPPGLPGSRMMVWKHAVQAAHRAAVEARWQREREAQANTASDLSQPKTDVVPAAPASREDRARLRDEMHEARLRERARVDADQIPLTLPDGDAALLLEMQIASSAALISHLSNYIARNDTDPFVCTSFMERMTAMLVASANVGKVVGRLRGQVSRSEQLINVNHMEGERGRG